MITGLKSVAILAAALLVQSAYAQKVPGADHSGPRRDSTKKVSVRRPGTGVEGRVYSIGAPAVRVGWTPPPHEQVCTIVVVDSADQTVKAVKTDAKGRYRIALPPGKYRLKVKESFIPSGGVEVEVKKGKMTHADTRFDNGIR